LDVTGLIASAMRADPAAYPATLRAEVVLGLVRQDGLAPLVLRGLRRGDRGWPQAVCRGLEAGVHEQIAIEHFYRLELIRVLRGMAERGLHPLLMKGAALAYTVYPSAALRPRNDTDLLVPDHERHRALQALSALGYVDAADAGGELSSAQAHLSTVDAAGLRHACDLHWRIANPLHFRDMVSVDELDAAATPVPRLSPDGRALAVHHALFVACIHRVAHHYDREMLLWIYDIHLLTEAASADDLEQFRALAVRVRACAVCARGLEAAASHFGTPVPPALLASLREAAGGEPSSAFLSGDLRLVDLLGHDLSALPSWRSRLALLREHVLPSAAYMRVTYAPGSRIPLPLLYASRIVRGAPKWFRRP
jgi:hypothetical protein